MAARGPAHTDQDANKWYVQYDDDGYYDLEPHEDVAPPLSPSTPGLSPEDNETAETAPPTVTADRGPDSPDSCPTRQDGSVKAVVRRWVSAAVNPWFNWLPVDLERAAGDLKRRIKRRKHKKRSEAIVEGGEPLGDRKSKKEKSKDKGKKHHKAGSVAVAAVEPQ